MKTKTIVTVALLLFIFASVAYLIVEELRQAPESPLLDVNSPVVVDNHEGSQKVVVYYFHGDFRCPTCRKFETYSDEVLQSAFADALNDSSLEWKVVNTDEPGNKHFVRDYQLYTKSIIVAKIQDGKQTEWKNLDKIWELVGNKAVFVKYIQDEVNAYLGAD